MRPYFRLNDSVEVLTQHGFCVVRRAFVRERPCQPARHCIRKSVAFRKALASGESFRRVFAQSAVVEGSISHILPFGGLDDRPCQSIMLDTQTRDIQGQVLTKSVSDEILKASCLASKIPSARPRICHSSPSPNFHPVSSPGPHPPSRLALRFCLPFRLIACLWFVQKERRSLGLGQKAGGWLQADLVNMCGRRPGT